MKTIPHKKPRNHVALALMQRNGAGAHQKTTKAIRTATKRELKKLLKKPPTEFGGFFIPNDYANDKRGENYLFIAQNMLT